MPGDKSITHSEDCRLRVMERAKTDSSIAARVKASQLRDLEAHAKLLEASDKGKREAASNSPEIRS